ncbi:nidogen-2-like [Uloborus diversus]|uniref:nidogen-2-like n=1 Tax=Uloborus diversus TaxID=327109 RepID=UPI0024098C10|nr:nidogen-2-like [Uloborus diversus]
MGITNGLANISGFLVPAFVGWAVRDGVNDNGFLSFLTEVPSFFNAQFPLTYPIIAPLYSDVDTRGSGRVYYRETQASELLERATRDIRSHFSNAGSFQPRSLFIVTWEEVGHYNRGTDKQNTFQVILASDGDDTYAYFLYPSGGVQWIQGQGKNPDLPDARAQAGFMSGDGRLYTLRGSGTEQERNFDRMSNARKPGLWLFHIGRPLGSEGNVMPADLESSPNNEDRPDGQSATCADTLLPCSPHSTCIDHPEKDGFCCVCKDNYFGNGRNCAEKNSPQRMNGKVSGMINDVQLQDADLHAYIVTEDGRTYTAISRVPSAVGSDLQILTPLGAVVGWLFAVSRSGAPNGFTITGGAFNRTVEVDFPQSGHHVFIEESFLGPDVFNYMRVQVKIRGTLPSIPDGSKIEIPDYEEEYTRISEGLIRSHASRSYRLEGNNLEVPFTLDQTITYSECEVPMLTTRLKVARNFIVYDGQEQIVRYAMTNKISPLSVEDPCKEGRHQCEPNSNCVVEGDSFRCACSQGYQAIYEEAIEAKRTTCIGNGVVCVEDSCDIADNCNPDGSCLYDEVGEAYYCACNAGFSGDGYVCLPERPFSSCDVINNCHPAAQCVFDSQSQRYQCRCNAGYRGDGQTCTRADDVGCDRVNICSPHALCTRDEFVGRYVCRCNEGYEGDGQTCTPVDECSTADNCDPNAQCLYDSGSQRYRCQCLAGFRGTGRIGGCSPDLDASCNVRNTCHEQAVCAYDSVDLRYRCQCNPGYNGDGYRCEKAEIPCNVINSCHVRAECVYDSGSRGYRLKNLILAQLCQSSSFVEEIRQQSRKEVQVEDFIEECL